MTKSVIGYSLLTIVAIVCIVLFTINIYTFSRRNAVYFNKRNWSNDNTEKTGDLNKCNS